MSTSCSKPDHLVELLDTLSPTSCPYMHVRRKTWHLCPLSLSYIYHASPCIPPH